MIERSPTKNSYVMLSLSSIDSPIQDPSSMAYLRVRRPVHKTQHHRQPTKPLAKDNPQTTEKKQTRTTTDLSRLAFKSPFNHNLMVPFFGHKLKIQLQKNPKYNKPGLTNAVQAEIKK